MDFFFFYFVIQTDKQQKEAQLHFCIERDFRSCFRISIKKNNKIYILYTISIHLVSNPPSLCRVLEVNAHLQESLSERQSEPSLPHC